jgi:hypothetical protein
MMFWFWLVMGVIFIYALAAPWIMGGKRLGSEGVLPVRGEDRGGPMDTIARWVVSFLGWTVSAILHLLVKLGANMATLQEVLDRFVGWGTGWKDRAVAAEARAEALQTGLTDAQAAAQASADALAQFQADSAATDATLIAAQAQADADAAQVALDSALTADLPPAPPVEPPVVEPPVVDLPVPEGSQ